MLSHILLIVTNVFELILLKLHEWWRIDDEVWQGIKTKKHIVIWIVSGHKTIHINLIFTRSRKSKIECCRGRNLINSVVIHINCLSNADRPCPGRLYRDVWKFWMVHECLYRDTLKIHQLIDSMGKGRARNRVSGGTCDLSTILVLSVSNMSIRWCLADLSLKTSSRVSKNQDKQKILRLAFQPTKPFLTIMEPC